MDEHEAQEALSNQYKEAQEAGNVWADIERNKLLNSVRDPPKELTPGLDENFHRAIKEYHFARLAKLTKPPSPKNEEPTSDKMLSVLADKSD